MRHGYDRRHFRGIWGANRQGGADKAELLRRIKARGYRDVLFVGDANRDLEYAHMAGVKFFRKEFFRSKTRRLVEALLTGHPLSSGEATDAIHA